MHWLFKLPSPSFSVSWNPNLHILHPKALNMNGDVIINIRSNICLPGQASVHIYMLVHPFRFLSKVTNGYWKNHFNRKWYHDHVWNHLMLPDVLVWTWFLLFLFLYFLPPTLLIAIWNMFVLMLELKSCQCNSQNLSRLS